MNVSSISNLEVYCASCDRFLDRWDPVESHQHALTFKQLNIPSATSATKPTTRCHLCNKECFNNFNLQEHRKFKHPSIQSLTTQSTQTNAANDDNEHQPASLVATSIDGLQQPSTSIKS